MLYTTPLGHFADNVMPDRPLWSNSTRPLRTIERCGASFAGPDRLVAWEEYFDLAIPHKVDDREDSFCDAITRVEALAKGANMGEGWSEESMRAALLGDEKPRAEFVFHAFKRGAFTRLPACHTVLACAEKASAFAHAPTCEDSWAEFREAAWKKFGYGTAVLASRISEGDGPAVTFLDDGDKYSEELSHCLPPDLPPTVLSDVPRSELRMQLGIRVSNITVAPSGKEASPAQSIICGHMTEPGGVPATTDTLQSGTCDADRWQPDSRDEGLLSIYFTTASSAWRDDQVLERFRGIGGLIGKRVIVTGFADERGSAESNDILSCARARSVAHALISEHLIDAKYVDTIAAGERDPVCEGTDTASQKECWCRSRRASIAIGR
jgi:hypothetical protein